jgi:hypothetical protein
LNASTLVTELSGQMRPVGVIGDTLYSLEVRPVGWQIDHVDVIGGRTYLSFDAGLESGVKKGEALIVIQGTPLRVLGSMKVDLVGFYVRGEDKREPLDRWWGWEEDEEVKRARERAELDAEQKARAKATKLNAIGVVSWAGGSRPSSWTQLYAVRGVPSTGVRQQFSSHGLTYVRGWAWGSERTLVALPHGAITALLGLLSLPLMAKLRRAIVRRRRLLKGRCGDCGYSLRGNVTGVCPECGMKTRHAKATMHLDVHS